MVVTIPSPPGYAAGFEQQRLARLQPASPANAHVIGVFERGTFGQIAGPGDVASTVGERQNNSTTIDAIHTLLGEGVPTINYSRVYGPAATRATLAIGGALTFTAKSPGPWAHDVEVAIVTATGGAERRIVVTENDEVIATSAAFATNADAVAFTAEQDLVDVAATSSTLAPITPAAPLAGGDADLDGITPASYLEAADRLDRRYGPGLLVVPGVTSIDVHAALLPHLEPNNRLAKFELDAAVTESAADEHSQGLEAEDPSVAWRWELYDGPTAVLPIPSQPERPVSWATVQAGITSRIFQELGVGPAPFGELRGQGLTVQRLLRERTSLLYPGGEVQRLYAGHVNVPVDRGQTINLEGLRTGSRDEMLSDGAGAFVRMVLAFEGETLARRRIGDFADRNTVVDYGADLEALCKRFVAARAFNDDFDAGFIVDVDTLNSPDSMRQRELHGLIRYHPTGSADWVDFIVGATSTQETF